MRYWGDGEGQIWPGSINYLQISTFDKPQTQPQLASIIKSFNADLRSLSGMSVLWCIRKTGGMSAEIISKIDNVFNDRVLTGSWEMVSWIKTMSILHVKLLIFYWKLRQVTWYVIISQGFPFGRYHRYPAKLLYQLRKQLSCSGASLPLSSPYNWVECEAVPLSLPLSNHRAKLQTDQSVMSVDCAWWWWWWSCGCIRQDRPATPS